MAGTTEEPEGERTRLGELARSIGDPQNHREASRRSAERDRERNRETYDELADE